VRINRDYAENWSLGCDLRCIADTIRAALAHQPKGATR
jgi:lipopolysaccharide/colanic/teichoic acid biosynthesis glycosyltransferase